MCVCVCTSSEKEHYTILRKHLCLHVMVIKDIKQNIVTLLYTLLLTSYTSLYMGMQIIFQYSCVCVGLLYAICINHVLVYVNY